MVKKTPEIAVIGGGTGTFTLLNGLRDKELTVSALLTMVDDGGSNRVLRDEFGLLPTSGIRQALVALSEQGTLLRELFNYRYHRGEGLSGMTFGNLFLAALTDILGSQEQAIEETSKLLAVKGSVLPISYDDVRLVATYEDGSEVLGEHLIDEPQHDGKLRITGLRTEPQATISEKARKTLETSNLVVMGPGDFYTNTISNLIIKGVVEAIEQTEAKVVMILNLMTKYGDAYDYRASDYLRDLDRYLSLAHLDVVVMNNDQNFPAEIVEKYEAEFSKPVIDDLDEMQLPTTLKVVRRSLVSTEIPTSQKGDVIKRSMIRHDSEKLGRLVIDLLAGS